MILEIELPDEEGEYYSPAFPGVPRRLLAQLCTIVGHRRGPEVFEFSAGFVRRRCQTCQEILKTRGYTLAEANAEKEREENHRWVGLQAHATLVGIRDSDLPAF